MNGRRDPYSRPNGQKPSSKAVSARSNAQRRYPQKRRKKTANRPVWILLTALLAAAFLAVVVLLCVKVSGGCARKADEASAREVLNAPAVQSRSDAENAVPETEASAVGTDAAENTAVGFDAAAQNTGLIADADIAAIAEREDLPALKGVLAFGDLALYVTQGKDNSYYASRDMRGEPLEGGVIYADYRSSLSPRGDNIVLYGHDMRDGTRFGMLNRFEDVDWLLENPYVELATADGVVRYRPISVFHTTVDRTSDDYFVFAQTEFVDQVDFEAYVSEVKERSLYFIPVTAEYGDGLLTMVTCISDRDRGRLVVVCVEE